MTDLRQWINRTVWMDGCDIETEERQAREEGRCLEEVQAEFDRLKAVSREERDEQWFKEAGRLVDRVQSLPYQEDFPYHEPSDLPGIKASRPTADPLPTWAGDDREWQDRLHAGLLGRICGCLLGKPIEGWERGWIRTVAEETRNWPIKNYFQRPGPGAARQFRCPDHWLAGGIDGMVEDDDINYTTIGFAVVKAHGASFTPLDVALYWCDNVPILHTCTAERVAYRNFVSNVIPPDSATVRNPYREWIGAQIRADYFGYANPGNPERAAEWAWRDASISHIKNGIYGEMWVAAMLAAAYVESDWTRIIYAGLAQIPEKCRLREDIEKIFQAQADGLDFAQTVQLIHAQWDETKAHYWCHTNSNAQIVVAALLHGEDDYEKTITLAVSPGFDTDCNAATCGSLWGIVHGLSSLPEKWTAPMNDHVRTGVHGYHDVSISKLAVDMHKTAAANK